MRPKKKVTMQDIAAALGISVVSVSNAYAGKKSVSKGLREKILSEGRRLGYVYAAGEESREKTYYALVTEGLGEKNRQKLAKELTASLFSGKAVLTGKTEGAAGIFAAGTLSSKTLEELAGSAVPAVVLGQADPGYALDFVVPAAFDSIQMALRILKKNGMRRAVLVRREKPEMETPEGRADEDRTLGFLCAEREEGTGAFFEEPSVYRGAGAFYRAMRELSREELPDAVLCTDISLANKVRRTAQDAGLFPVPPRILPCCSEEELSLHLFSSGIVPDREEMVREAVSCMEHPHRGSGAGRIYPVQEKLLVDGERLQEETR